MLNSMKTTWQSWSGLMVVMSCLSVGTGCGAGDMTEGDELNTQQQAVSTTAVQKCSSLGFSVMYPPPFDG